MAIVEAAAPATTGPPLPMGRRIVLRKRGTTFVREVEGPPGAPTVLLLHGWLASAGLNWFRVFDELGRDFRVVAMDMRGHGRGIRSARRFRLADCADDAAALLDVLDAGPAIVVGYSLGGPVAQLLWQRHRDAVQGLVLCATAHTLLPGMREQWAFTTMMGVAAGTTRAGQLITKVPRQRARHRSLAAAQANPPARPSSLQTWARAEMRRHSYRMVLEAGVAMSNFSSRRWIGDIDVPCTVVVTTRDRAIPPLAQLHMALAIPGAHVHRIDDGHLVCAKSTFSAPIADAVRSVAARVG